MNWRLALFSKNIPHTRVHMLSNAKIPLETDLELFYPTTDTYVEQEYPTLMEMPNTSATHPYKTIHMWLVYVTHRTFRDTFWHFSIYQPAQQIRK